MVGDRDPRRCQRRAAATAAPSGRAMTRPRRLHSGPHRMVMTRPARRPESLDVVCRKGGQARLRALHRVTQPDRYVEHCEEEVGPLPVPAER